MNKIESGEKLDFNNVLIRPKRSTINSRSEVTLDRTFKFKHTNNLWEGVPIISANMDTTGTFEVYKTLSKHMIITALHKFYTKEDYVNFNLNNEKLDPNYFMVSTGISDNDFENLKSILNEVLVKWICIDIANGYISKLVEFCQKVRKEFPDKIIVAGNVVTREMVEELILNGGVDVVKVGIGPGCFASDTKILLANGTYKNISDIEIGDMVINKNGEPVEVINKFNKGLRNLYKIKTNNWHDETYVTPDHKYWIGDLSSSSERSFSGTCKSKQLDKLSKTTPKSSKYKWKSLDEITKKDLLLLPNDIKWKLDSDFRIDLSEFCNKGEIKDNNIITKTSQNNNFNRYLRSTYNLGYIFGTFLGDGNAHISNFKKSERESCHWSFGLHDVDIAKKLQESIKKELNYECSILEKDNNVLSVNCYNKCLSKLLSQFSKKTEKHLPKKYYCSNIEYIQGLYDGLIDSDGTTENCKGNKVINTLKNTSKQILELFYWCCMNLKISYSVCKINKSIGNLKGTCVENLKDCFRIKTHTHNRFTKDYVYSEMFNYEKTEPQVTWDIEVNCPTHSFIANNSIVHNSACTTRLKTGVGMPQLSAVLECADAAHGVGGQIISDGGITCPGDMAKAFGAGADFVMVGGQFAAHDQNPGEVIEENGKKMKMFYGMSSDKAQEKHYGKMEKYRASEGRILKIPYKGDLNNTVLDYLGGLRSTCAYINAPNIKQMAKCTTFVKVSQQVNSFFV
jgi:IMP dehydrogenase/GMP reductase